MPTGKHSDSSARGSRRTRAKTRLLKLLSDDAMSVDLARGFAGERKLTAQEKEMIGRLQEERGDAFYSDLLFSVSHQYFQPARAKELWGAIKKHTAEMEKKLGRRVRLIVAVLDYLYDQLENPIIISEPRMNTIAEIAVKDGLTRLYDHSTFLSKLRDEIKRYKRYGNEISVILIDADHFKDVNDQWGHPSGDDVLARLAKIIYEEIRDIDVAARYGGEEFAVFLPRTPRNDAIDIAERLRQLVKAEFADSYGLTISAGVATCPEDGKTVETLVRNADRALYFSKQQGRNRVSSYPDVP